MGKKKTDKGIVIITRDDETPDSERHVTRDDPLFPFLEPIFKGEVIHIDFEAIAAAANEALKPATSFTAVDVYTDLHENFGYVCIGTGENPAAGEALSPEEKIARQAKIEKALTDAKIPHIKIKGKYMGVEEYSYFIPFNDRAIGLSAMLQGEMIDNLVKIASDYNQDSLLICQNGQACYLYTSGPQKGCVNIGKSAAVYPGQELLPDDCYSLFLNADDTGTIGFTCAINFTVTYKNIEDYVAAERKAKEEHYEEFTTALVAPAAQLSKRPKTIIILRGTNGYDDYALELKKILTVAGIKTAIVGSDANIAKIGEEVASDNVAVPKGPKAGWEWDQIRIEFIKRNMEIYQSLLQSDTEIIIFADMNKLAAFMNPFIVPAKRQGHNVIINVVNGFVFEPLRSSFVLKLCEKFGAFMSRHVGDFVSEKGQILDKSIKVEDMDIPQYSCVFAKDLVRVALFALSNFGKSIQAALSGASGALFEPTPLSITPLERVKKESEAPRPSLAANQ